MSDVKVASLAGESPGFRGKRLWERALEDRKNARLSLARALLVLESYRETEGLPAPIRRTRALEKSYQGSLFNDSIETVSRIAAFVKSELGCRDIDLLAYNRMGEVKYSWRLSVKKESVTAR